MEKTSFGHKICRGICGLCVILAVGAGFIAILTAATVVPLAIRGDCAEGTVIQVHEEYLEYADGGELRRWAVVRFRAGPNTMEVKKNWGLSLNQGERVPVRYEVDDPDNARIERFWHVYGPMIGFAVTTLVLSILGTLFYRASR